MFRSAYRSSLSSALRTSAPHRVSPSAHGLLARRFLSQDARAQITKAVNSHPLVLFMKGNPQLPQCGFSRAVVQILDLHGVPPEKMQTYDVLEDQELRSGIKEFSEWPTVPQVYVGGEFVGGCDIVMNMHQSGELETLLEKHDIIPKADSASEAPSTAPPS